MNKLSMFIIAGVVAAPIQACGKKAEAPAPTPEAVAKAEPAAEPVVAAEPAGEAAKPAEVAAVPEVAAVDEAAAVAVDAVAAVVAPVNTAVIALNTLKFGGEGYDAEFNEALSSWTIEKYVPDTTSEDGGNTKIVTIYLNMWDAENWPTDMTAFSDKLKVKDFLDMGSIWTIAGTEAFEGGWIVTGASNDGEDNQTAFAVRNDKLNALCRGYVATEIEEAKRAAIVTEAIEACKTAMIP